MITFIIPSLIFEVDLSGILEVFGKMACSASPISKGGESYLGRSFGSCAKLKDYLNESDIKYKN